MIPYLREKIFKKAQNAVDSLGIGSLKGKISDGHHTFDDLYAHRNELFITLCRHFAKNTHIYTWRKPIEGGYFLVGIYDEEGKQISYHLPADKWEETNFINFTDEPRIEYDGHSSNDVLERLKTL